MKITTRLTRAAWSALPFAALTAAVGYRMGLHSCVSPGSVLANVFAARDVMEAWAIGLVAFLIIDAGLRRGRPLRVYAVMRSSRLSHALEAQGRDGYGRIGSSTTA